MSLLSDTTKAIQGAPGLIQGFLGLTTPSRLRRELRETMDLYQRAVKLAGDAKGHPEVNEAAAILARLIKKEVNDLNAVVGGPLRIFQPDWRAIGTLTVLVLFLVVCEALLLGSGVRAHVLGWVLILAVSGGAVMLATVLALVLLQAVRGPQRTVITDLRPEDLAGLLGMASGQPDDAAAGRAAELEPPHA